MPNTYFQFKQFRIDQQNCAMKVCTDACILGAWYASKLGVRPRRDRPGDPASHRILDVGSGTGLLMMMLAQATDALIDGIEIEPACYQQMKLNISQNKWTPRLSAIEGDARNYAFPNHYDFIISNPPFYDNDLSSPVPGRQVAMHSEMLKLGELVEIVIKNLDPAGKAGIMLPSHRAPVLEALAIEKGLYPLEYLDIRQTPGHTAFRTITTFGFIKTASPERNELIIRDHGNVYSKSFAELLAPYYLHLAVDTAQSNDNP